ncbi:MAG: pilus assembly protein [Pseudomonadota bacterium]
MIGQLVRRKIRDEKGSFSVEAILMFPLLIWAFMAMYVFYEGLRESNINLKATYTLGDLLSRETEVIDMAYLEGMTGVYSWLSRSARPVSMRVTSVRFDQDANPQHIMLWSRGVDQPDLVQADVTEDIAPHIPITADSDTVIIVETWTTYDPIIDIGLTDTDIYNLVVTAPRFSKQLRFEGVGDGTGETHDDGLSDDEDPGT